MYCTVSAVTASVFNSASLGGTLTSPSALCQDVNISIITPAAAYPMPVGGGMCVYICVCVRVEEGVSESVRQSMSQSLGESVSQREGERKASGEEWNKGGRNGGMKE